jgi:dipeptidyl aminopeptidase/acylaminoacyl peptidase
LTNSATDIGWLVLALAVSLSCILVASQLHAQDASTSITTPAKAVFVRESDLWIINEDGSGLRQLTRDRRPKGSPVWSPGGSRIAYLSSPPPGLPTPTVRPKRKSSERVLQRIIVIEETGEAVSDIDIYSGDFNVNGITGLEWPGDNTIGYKGHINPSLSIYTTEPAHECGRRVDRAVLARVF